MVFARILFLSITGFAVHDNQANLGPSFNLTTLQRPALLKFCINSQRVGKALSLMSAASLLTASISYQEGNF